MLLDSAGGFSPKDEGNESNAAVTREGLAPPQIGETTVC